MHNCLLIGESTQEYLAYMTCNLEKKPIEKQVDIVLQYKFISLDVYLLCEVHLMRLSPMHAEP